MNTTELFILPRGEICEKELLLIFIYSRRRLLIFAEEVAVGLESIQCTFNAARLLVCSNRWSAI